MSDKPVITAGLCRQVERYKDSESEYRRAETALNMEVNRFLQRDDVSEEDLIKLVNTLPKDYGGAQRVYHRILKMRSPEDA